MDDSPQLFSSKTGSGCEVCPLHPGVYGQWEHEDSPWLGSWSHCRGGQTACQGQVWLAGIKWINWIHIIVPTFEERAKYLRLGWFFIQSTFDFSTDHFWSKFFYIIWKFCILLSFFKKILKRFSKIIGTFALIYEQSCSSNIFSS